MAQKQIHMNKKVQETVEILQLQFLDKVMDAPVVLVAQVPQRQVVPTVGIPQLPFDDKIVMIPRFQTVQPSDL